MDDLDRSLLDALHALMPAEFDESLARLRRLPYWPSADEAALHARTAKRRAPLRVDDHCMSNVSDRQSADS